MANERYYKRKALGLCGICGKASPVEGKTMCQNCLEKNRKRANETRQFRISMGFCPVCGKNKLFGREGTCIECRAIIANRNAVNRNRRYGAKAEYNRQYMRDRYKSNVEKGICPQCGCRKARTGKKTCYICAEKSRIKYAQTSTRLTKIQKEEKELCHFCNNPRKIGMKVCEKHHRMYLEMDKNVKARIAYGIK